MFAGIKQWLPQKLRILEILKIRLHSTGPALGYGETLGTKCKGTQTVSKLGHFNTILLEIIGNAEKPMMNKFTFLEQLENVILMQFGRILATDILCQSTTNEDKKSDNERSKTGLFYLHTQHLFTTPDVDYVHSNTAGICSTVSAV